MQQDNFPFRGLYPMALSAMMILHFFTAGHSGVNGVKSLKSPACAAGFTNPFGCKFSFGSYQSNLLNQLDFVGTWIGDETNGGLNTWSSSGVNNSCGDCNLVKSVAGQAGKFVVFYAYFIGFQACKKGGFCDCNTQPNSPNLCTNGAKWIRENRDQIIRAYGEYAKVVHQNSPNKPVIWWLEGDFIQYSYTDQSNPLSYAELGKLAYDITCAIKQNEPGAIVAMNHSPWISDAQMKGFWAAMPPEIDMVWLQGPGDSNVLNNSWAKTGCYDSLAKYSNRRPMMAETSYGTPDRWTTTTVDNINARIAQGVIGVHFNSTPSSNDLSKISAYRPLLANPCMATGLSAWRRILRAQVERGIVRAGNTLIFPDTTGVVYLISMTGKQVMNQQIAGGICTIDLSRLCAGVYFVKTSNAMVRFIHQP